MLYLGWDLLWDWDYMHLTWTPTSHFSPLLTPGWSWLCRLLMQAKKHAMHTVNCNTEQYTCTWPTREVRILAKIHFLYYIIQQRTPDTVLIYTGFMYSSSYLVYLCFIHLSDDSLLTLICRTIQFMMWEHSFWDQVSFSQRSSLQNSKIFPFEKKVKKNLTLCSPWKFLAIFLFFWGFFLFVFYKKQKPNK